MAHLVFDYDGTLHDSLGIYAPAFRRTYAWLVAHGHAPLRHFDDSEISRWLGWTARDMWNAFLPQLPDDLKQACAANVTRNMLWGIANGQARLYDGIEDALAQLKRQGHTLVFLSNCRHAYMQAHRQTFGLDRFFSGFYCTEDHDWAPKPVVFQHIQRDFGTDQLYLAIGDRFHDIELAASGDMPSVGCLYGFGSPDELSTATQLVANPSQIVGAVERILAEG